MDLESASVLISRVLRNDAESEADAERSESRITIAGESVGNAQGQAMRDTYIKDGGRGDMAST